MVLPSWFTGNSSRLLLAGPCTTWPDWLNFDPWQVHVASVDPNTQFRLHLLCVQTDVKALISPSTLTSKTLSSGWSNQLLGSDNSLKGAMLKSISIPSPRLGCGSSSQEKVSPRLASTAALPVVSKKTLLFIYLKNRPKTYLSYRSNVLGKTINQNISRNLFRTMIVQTLIEFWSRLIYL